ncbi:hypothetical protein [Limnoglobus roseus]|uniref:Cytochrome c domain-containing protein n=1 Tax=Limnoglobus roseus TaxID=2598579 RepID=A0A5C1ANA0_9BACT|nr:hypothetical protein [Limnoglobus roseus]QEL19202.1 hypothetical protein PX52LOC_06262 [Limnoglobus roseus]
MLERTKSPAAHWATTLATLLFGSILCTGVRAAEPIGVSNPVHGYDAPPSRDRLAKLKGEVEAGRVTLDTSDELALLRSVLRSLDVPATSQMLVTSATSFQKTIISPKRPRALYFNDDTYVGFVPGGQIEVISIDPDRGGMFYIFNRLERGKVPRIRRSENCLTCHATAKMEEIPQLVIESVVPGITGGGEMAFRRDQHGHGVPLEDRFGGWLVTGGPDVLKHRGNVLVEWKKGQAVERPIKPGELYDPARFPLPTSDLLPHLLHEHQIGFVNQAVAASYRTRVLLHENAGKAEAVSAELEKLARELVRYLLFADEVPLPKGGVEGSKEFKADFLAKRRIASNGYSLRDLDLKTRLMRFRCSYMIESSAFAGLPEPLRYHVDRELARALGPESGGKEYAYLPADEKRVIREVLAETVLNSSRPQQK